MATIKIVYPQGKPTSSDTGWGLETDLDVQMVHAIAPHANIVLEVTFDNSFNKLFGGAQDAYTNQGASVVSMSFGGGEFSGETSFDNIFLTGNNQGVSFTASSGDSGYGAQYPAASPYLTSVGGTNLYTSSLGVYANETAWNGSGGGVSAYESRSSYQNGFNSYANRGIPDVAMVASDATPVAEYDTFGYSGWIEVYGTSVAAPLWAGVLSEAQNVHGGVGFNNADYGLYNAASHGYAGHYHDVTSGTNGTCGTVCTAGPGYDFITGLGSPIIKSLTSYLGTH